MDTDFSFLDIFELLSFVSFDECVEHEGYLDQLLALDFSKECDARFAIRKWLVPVFEDGRGRTEIGRQRVRNALRVAMSRWGFLPLEAAFPGIDDLNAPDRSAPEIFMLKRQFFRWLWDELFHEPYVTIPIEDGTLERTDSNFVNAPNRPELWGDATFRPVAFYDRNIFSDTWRKNWPQKAG